MVASETRVRIYVWSMSEKKKKKEKKNLPVSGCGFSDCKMGIIILCAYKFAVNSK